MQNYLNQLKILNEKIYNLKKTINLYKMLIELVLDENQDYGTDSYSFNENDQKEIILCTKSKMDAEHDLTQLRKKREFVLSQKEISEAISDSDVLSLYEAFSNQGSQTKNFRYLDEQDRKYLISLLRKKLAKIRITRKEIDLDPNSKINFFVN